MRISDWSSDVCSSDLVGAARGGISTICKLEGRIIALKIEHFEEVLRFRQLQLRRNALGERPRFQQAILRLVEFLVGNARLALNSLKVCNLVRLAREFDRRRRGILRRHQQGRDQTEPKTYRDPPKEKIAPPNGKTKNIK